MLSKHVNCFTTDFSINLNLSSGGGGERKREDPLIHPHQEEAMISIAVFSSLKCKRVPYYLLTGKTLKIFCIK